MTPDGRSLAAAVADAAVAVPGRPAAIVNGQKLSYLELDRDARTLAAHLAGLGVGRADRICVASSRKREYVIALVAVAAAGATAVPLPDADPLQARELVAAVGPRAVLGAADQLAGLGLGPAVPLVAIESVIGAGEASFSPLTMEAQDVPLILYSSGTTSGDRKLIRLSCAGLVDVVANLNEEVPIPEGAVEYLTSPPNHAFGHGRVCAVISRAGTLVMDDGMFNPMRALAALRNHACVCLSGVASAFSLLVESFPRQLAEYGRSLRWMEIGSVAMPLIRKRALLDLLPEADPVLEYGMTEAMRSTFVSFRRRPDKLATVGRATRGVEIAVIGPDRRILPPGERGEVIVRGTNLALGYWNREDLWNSRMHDGWFRSGDLGSIDQEGYLTYVGRVDDTINCGGNKISPDEIEDIIADAMTGTPFCVVGIDDPTGLLGQIPVLCVEGDYDREPEITRVMADRLPAWKKPRRVVRLAALPRTPSGKIMRRRIPPLIG